MTTSEWKPNLPGICSYCGGSTRRGYEPLDKTYPAPKCRCPGGGDWQPAYKQLREPGTEDEEVDPMEHPSSGWRSNGHRGKHGFSQIPLQPTETEDLLASFGPMVATLIRHRVMYHETIEQAAKAAGISETTANRMLSEALTLLRVSLM